MVDYLSFYSLVKVYRGGTGFDYFSTYSLIGGTGFDYFNTYSDYSNIDYKKDIENENG